MRALIAGLGNVFRSDDGFGVAVVAALRDRELPDGVELGDFGIRGVHLAYQLLDGYDLVVIVDAVQRGGVPGTCYVLEHGATEAGEAAQRGRVDEPLLDAHDLAPDAVLDLVPVLGGTLGRVVVIGCEPADTAVGMGLSEVVGGSVEFAAQLALRTVTDESGVIADRVSAGARTGGRVR